MNALRSKALLTKSGPLSMRIVLGASGSTSGRALFAACSRSPSRRRRLGLKVTILRARRGSGFLVRVACEDNVGAIRRWRVSQVPRHSGRIIVGYGPRESFGRIAGFSFCCFSTKVASIVRNGDLRKIIQIDMDAFYGSVARRPLAAWSPCRCRLCREGVVHRRLEGKLRDWRSSAITSRANLDIAATDLSGLRRHDAGCLRRCRSFQGIGPRVGSEPQTGATLPLIVWASRPADRIAM
jgi:hypothetical protein